MQVDDRVKWSEPFKARYGDDWPFDHFEEGTVEEVGDNRLGQQMCLVAWDHEPFNPQMHPAMHLEKVAE